MRIFIEEKKFDSKVVLENLSLSVAPEEKVLIIAPSGKGKTTLLRIISGLDRDFKGKIEECFNFPAMVFQEDRLIEDISVIANLLAVTNDKKKILELLGKVGLGDAENKKVSTLSGGMKRRVAIIRALLLDYDVLVLDEPFTGMNDELKKVVSDVILKENKNRALILVTHSKEEADYLGITKCCKL